MNPGTLNARLLAAIRRHTENEKIVSLLTKLCYEERDNPGKWAWKKVYIEMIGEVFGIHGEDEDEI
jgi:hypothetical protein